MANLLRPRRHSSMPLAEGARPTTAMVRPLTTLRIAVVTPRAMPIGGRQRAKHRREMGITAERGQSSRHPRPVRLLRRVRRTSRLARRRRSTVDLARLRRARVTTDEATWENVKNERSSRRYENCDGRPPRLASIRDAAQYTQAQAGQSTCRSRGSISSPYSAKASPIWSSGISVR